VSDLWALTPITEEDYARVVGFIEAQRGAWERLAAAGLEDLIHHLRAAGYQPYTTEDRADVAAGHDTLDSAELVVSCR
jgi:hypothetical protein